MEETQDNFSFDDFLTSDESKQEFGTATETSVEPAPTPVETPQETETPTETTAPEPTETVVPEKVETPEGMPVKAVDEPDWKYDYRLEIWEKQQLLKQAKSDSERAEIKNDINSVRKEIAQRAKEEVQDFDPTNIEEIIEQKLAIREQVKVVDQAEADFIKRHPEMRNDAVYREFVQYVADTYNIQNKSYKALTAILETAHETLYPKNIQQRIEKSKEVEQKINAVDFTGSSASPEVSPEKQEEKALVDDIRAKSGNDFSWTL